MPTRSIGKATLKTDITIPNEFAPLPYREIPDWHASALRCIARQLGVGSDAYFPLMGAAHKLEMFRRGTTYQAAVQWEGGEGTCTEV